ncbi:MAG: alkaline phosphatase family protein [Candidatus Thiodiazotropha sp.]
MRLPDYHGGSIVNLMASLQAGLGGGGHAFHPPLKLLSPERIGHYRKVLLWVIDGLGYHYLLRHAQAIHLNAALQGSMTSVYPPTTASAVTTYLTGDAPQQHGLTGWFTYFRELGSVMTVLPGNARYGRAGYGASGIDAAALLGHTPFSNRIAREACTIQPAHIANSDFSLAHLGPAQLLSYRSLEEMVQQSVRILQTPGERYVYLYWPELDTIGHHSGIGSEAAQRHLLQLDAAFAELLQRLQGSDTLVIVSADHGMIDTSPAQTVDLGDHPDLADMLILPLCGEPRSAFCYLRPGTGDAFDDYVTHELSDKVELFHSSQLMDAHWFGLGDPHPELARRIGDRLLLMRSNAIIKDWVAQEKRFQMIGVHGGLSDDELFVPLILAET